MGRAPTNKAIMKCPEELWIPNSKEAGEWRMRNSQELYQL